MNPPTVMVRVPAKVNLQLSVGALRPDGYHDLVNVFHAVGIYDDVTATPGWGGVSVTVSGADAHLVPTDETNLAARAAQALAAAAGVDAEVDLHIHKGIPVAGGMAGGSADAAATLVACDLLWGTGLSREQLGDLAATLGADVPFALIGGTAVGLGTGVQLTPALARGRFAWVLAVADGGLSTAEVYAEYDRLIEGRVLPEPRLSDQLMAALRSGDTHALARTLTNDLQPAAVSMRPALQGTLDTGLEAGALAAVVSGSGPTCAFLVVDEAHGHDLTGTLSASGVCRSVVATVGPVHGARVIEHAG